MIFSNRMGFGMSESDNTKRTLPERMKQEWDQRIHRDYRYWMSDGFESDASMWESGERDFALLSQGLPDDFAANSIALEVGCGVGRLLRAASNKFQQVIGVDVSEAAVKKAEQLLQDRPNVDVFVGNGLSLLEVPDSSIDFIYSFAALGNMPLRVIVNYLREISRIARIGGRVTVQLYVGTAQRTAEEDTLAIRVLNQTGLMQVFHDLGFSVIRSTELVLPIEVSDHAKNVVAQLFELERLEIAPQYLSNYDVLLMSDGEVSEGATFRGSESAYAMCMARAQDLLKHGDRAGAIEWLNFAAETLPSADGEVRKIVGRLDEKPKVQTTQPQIAVTRDESERFFRQNLEVLNARFPEAAAAVRSASGNPCQISRASNGEPLLYLNGTPLDNIEKPSRGGEVWAERALSGIGKAETLTVLGFAAGYHVEALLKRSGSPVFVAEPSPDVLKSALSSRDLRPVLDQIAGLYVGTDAKKFFQALGPTDILVHPQSQVLLREGIGRLRECFWSTRGRLDLRPAITVVGPMYGGSLPIARYVVDALSKLGQRVQYIDMSAHNTAYTECSRYVRSMAALDSVQGRYLETLSQIVLEAENDRHIDILICLAQAPVLPRALTELRKRGTITAMWFVEDCRRFLGWQTLSQYFDYMFLIQRDGVPELVQQAGAGRAIYLPVGADPKFHCPTPLTPEERKEWGGQLSFVGAGYHNRQQMFASLADRDFKIWGTDWPGCTPFDRIVQAKGRRIDPSEYIKIFNATDININLHSSTERDGVEPNGDFVNPRTFELASCGAFQLVDNRTLLPDLFDVENELATFSDKRELFDKIDYYLRHPEERAAMSLRARNRVLKEHTYEQRVSDMLGYIYADHYQTLKQESNCGAWSRTLQSASDFPELTSRLERVKERGDDPKLEHLVTDITTGKGNLTDTEKKILFLHHIRTQIAYIEEKRSGKG